MKSEILDYSNIGNRIKEVMSWGNTSVSDFSGRTGVSRFSVAQWLKGKNLTADALYLIANEFNVSINWIMFGIGEQQRSSGYIPTDMEVEFISIIRHIEHGCTSSVLSLLKSLNAINGASPTVNSCKLTGDFFDRTNTPMAIVQMDGTILFCNPKFCELLGIPEIQSQATMPNLFSMASSHYIYRLKCDMGVVFTNGAGNYNQYEFKHQTDGRVISIIAKSALIEHKGQLAQVMIFREIS